MTDAGYAPRLNVKDLCCDVDSCGERMQSTLLYGETNEKILQFL